MYKVFIENKPVIFQIDPQVNDERSTKKVWQDINSFINNTEEVLTVQLKSSKEFFQIFKNHEIIEAAGGLVEKNHKYLFIFRNGFWDIPKGKREEGESIEICAIRELEEECGIEEPKIVNHLIDTWHTYDFKGKKVLKRTYWYLMKEGKEIIELVPQLEEGITEVKFFGKDEFYLIKNETFSSIIQVLEELENLIKK